MLNDIIDGIFLALDARFGDRFTYRREPQEQGADEGAFFVIPLKGQSKPLIGPRSIRTYPIDVRLFNESATHADLYTLGDELIELLEFITTAQGIVRGYGFEYNVTDGVLHVIGSYPVVMERAVEVADAPETLSQLMTIGE